MNNKLVIEIKGKVREGDILVFKEGSFIAVKVKSLLPELEKLQKQIDELKEENNSLKSYCEILERKIEKNSHDILVDRGLADE